MKKRFTTVFLLFVVLATLFAGTSYSPGFNGSLGGSFLFAKADYLKTAQGNELPKVRTSFALNLDVMALDFTFNRFEVGAGYSLQWTSQSLAAGIHFIQPYLGMGVAVGGSFHISEKFAVGMKGRILWCKYRPYNYKFNVIEAEVIPAMNVGKSNGFDINLIAPVTFAFKSDSVSVKVMVGFDLHYNLMFNKREAKNEKK